MVWVFEFLGYITVWLFPLQPDNGDSFAKKGDLIMSTEHVIEMVTKATLLVKNLTLRLPEIEVAPQ